MEAYKLYFTLIKYNTDNTHAKVIVTFLILLRIVFQEFFDFFYWKEEQYYYIQYKAMFFLNISYVSYVT